MFLGFSSPRLSVFAEKGIFIFMIFRGGSAHLRNEMLAAGRKFFNFSAFRNFSGGGPETILGWLEGPATHNPYTHVLIRVVRDGGPDRCNHESFPRSTAHPGP